MVSRTTKWQVFFCEATNHGQSVEIYIEAMAISEGCCNFTLNGFPSLKRVVQGKLDDKQIDRILDACN